MASGSIPKVVHILYAESSSFLDRSRSPARANVPGKKASSAPNSVPTRLPPTKMPNEPESSALPGTGFLSDAELLGAVTNGKNNKMPSYKDKLSGDQIKDLISVIRDLGKK